MTSLTLHGFHASHEQIGPGSLLAAAVRAGFDAWGWYAVLDYDADSVLAQTFVP